MDKKNLARRWFMKGCRYDRLESNLDQAIDAYKKSIKYDDKYTDAYVNLGFAFVARMNCGKAV